MSPSFPPFTTPALPPLSHWQSVIIWVINHGTLPKAQNCNTCDDGNDSYPQLAHYINTDTLLRLGRLFPDAKLGFWFSTQTRFFLFIRISLRWEINCWSDYCNKSELLHICTILLSEVCNVLFKHCVQTHFSSITAQVFMKHIFKALSEHRKNLLIYK